MQKQNVNMVTRESLHQKIMRISGLYFDQNNLITKILTTAVQRCSKDLPRDAIERLQPFYGIHASIVRIEDCDFSSAINSIRVLTKEEKRSASTTWILFGKLAHFDVSLKLTLLPTNLKALLDENSLEIERLIYRKVINPLIMCGLTPHVVAYYGELFCENFTDFLNGKIAQGDKPIIELAKELQKSIEVNPNSNPMPPPFNKPKTEKIPQLNINKMRCLITERVVGEQLGKGMRELQLKSSDLESVQKTIFVKFYLPILFQVFYTLAVFGEVGLVHNDLHTGNVFVQKYVKEVENCYLINGKLYLLRTMYQSRIFDFDRGAKLPTVFDKTELRNTLLSRQHYCEEFGQCQSVDERRELFTFCYYMYQQNNPRNIFLENLLQKIVPLELLIRLSSDQIKNKKDIAVGKTLAYFGRLCACKSKLCENCQLINDRRILTPKQIIALPVFDRFLIDPSQVGSKFIWTLPSEANADASERFKSAAQ